MTGCRWSGSLEEKPVKNITRRLNLNECLQALFKFGDISDSVACSCRELPDTHVPLPARSGSRLRFLFQFAPGPPSNCLLPLRSPCYRSVSSFSMDGTPFVCEAARLNIHDLPTDVLVHIFSFLHGQDIARCIEVSRFVLFLLSDLTCNKVCHCFADLIRSDLYLQYKIELAQNGMVDGHSSTIPTFEKLQRLREYSSRFRSGRFDHEDLAAHPHYVHQMRNSRYQATSVDESSLSSLHGPDVRIPTFMHNQDGPSDMFLSVFTLGSGQAGTQSSRSLLRISPADEHAMITTKWAIDGSQDLLVMTGPGRTNIGMSEHLRSEYVLFHVFVHDAMTDLTYFQA